MKNNLGVGVMLNMLFGEDGYQHFKDVIGKTIKKVWLAEDVLNLQFEDDSSIYIRDDGQSCCEYRYMQTDDILEDFIGAQLVDGEIREGPAQEEEYGEAHEIQFLAIKTSKGNFTMASHNEHNGYYGGFSIVIGKG